MHGRDHFRRQLRLQNFAALASNAKLRSEDRLRRRRAHANEQARPNDSELRFEPGPARSDLARVRLLVDAALATRFPFEMLHRVGDVNLRPIDPRFLERAIENFSRRTDEWFAGEVFLVAWLFAQQH